jgi:biopolymer transport protein ExbD
MAVSTSESQSGSSSVDVQVNLVPFIDLMSCLVAFLLVTAVWTNISQLRVTPAGNSAEGLRGPIDLVRLSLLVTDDGYFVGLTSGEVQRVADGPALAAALGRFRDHPALGGRRELELAAEDGVTYQAIVDAMDTAIAQGFDEIGFAEPASLSVRFVR